MLEIKRRCDICGATSSNINFNVKYKVKAKKIPFGLKAWNSPTRWEEADICDDCIKSIREMQTGYSRNSSDVVNPPKSVTAQSDD